MSQKEKIQEILKANLDSEEFAYFLFWSRAKWDYKKTSDFDVWIYGNKKLDFWKYLLLKDTLQENISYPVDLIDFQRCNNQGSSLVIY